jgi:hypothetical protein
MRQPFLLELWTGLGLGNTSIPTGLGLGNIGIPTGLGSNNISIRIDVCNARKLAEAMVSFTRGSW